MLLSWVFMIVGVLYGYAARNDLPVLTRTMQLNGIGFNFPATGIVWIGVCLMAVLIFGAAATRPIPREARVIARPADLSMAVTIAGLGHVVILVVVILWVLLGAQGVGGFDRLIAMAAQQETYAAREAILDSKLFPGMRLLYTGLICLGVFGASVFAVNFRKPGRVTRDMQIGALMFLTSAVALSLLPIILSQRILLVQMVLSTFVAVSMVAGRPFRLRYGIILGILLFAVWSLREAVTVGDWAGENYSPVRIGAEKLLYYLVNDFYNAVGPFSKEFLNTWGVYSFKFLLYFTGTQDAIHAAMSDRIAAVEELRAGGVFPAFTAPFVDFSWLGIVFVVAVIVLFTWVFNRAHRSFTFAIIYGQIGGALLLTPHVAWYSHHNFIFNILLTMLICAFIRRPAPESRGYPYHGKPA